MQAISSRGHLFIKGYFFKLSSIGNNINICQNPEIFRTNVLQRMIPYSFRCIKIADLFIQNVTTELCYEQNDSDANSPLLDNNVFISKYLDDYLNWNLYLGESFVYKYSSSSHDFSAYRI